MKYELIYKQKGVSKSRRCERFFDALGAAIDVLESEHGEIDGIKQDGEWVLKSGVLNGIWCALGTVKGNIGMKEMAAVKLRSDITGTRDSEQLKFVFGPHSSEGGNARRRRCGKGVSDSANSGR